jgi:hypothetical protein
VIIFCAMFLSANIIVKKAKVWAEQIEA